jgi:hypothetical protein
VLPIIWLEVVPGELSEELRGMIYHSSFSVNAVEMYFKYGSLLACLVLLMFIGTILYCRSQISRNKIDHELGHRNLNKCVMTKLNPTKSDNVDKTDEGSELEKVMNTD